ncbi:ABC transporter ATP-binding protein [Parapedobacter deserti]|uniref:ABC transporter ATP-binding protein n=1 Tax=Parapedobacter deserti TaxID=1912957 RepID=A0ABV7JMG2_9SPHI
MVSLTNITKTYSKGAISAVKDASFSVAEGELFGLIGPDGAGKSTIFRMLTTLLVPDSGTATVAGHDIVTSYKAIRRKVGYMPGRFSLYQDLSIEENLRFFATVFNTTMEKNYALIADIYAQIAPFKNRRAGKLSGGMKQKLALCCALIHKPEVLFLDEPTTGVDPVSRKEFWEMLGRLKQHGITILVSTPYMDEASLCDRVALIQQGSIMSIDTPGGITAAYPSKLYAVKATDMPRLIHVLSTYEPRLDAYLFGEYIHAHTRGKDDAAMEQRLRQFLVERRFSGVEVKPIAPSIEDCFIKMLTHHEK